MTNAKRAEFDRLWNTDNISKRTQFRNWMKAKLDVLHVDVTEENARAFYNGHLSVRQPERIYQMPERSEGGPRDRRGPPRSRRPPR